MTLSSYHHEDSKPTAPSLYVVKVATNSEIPFKPNNRKADTESHRANKLLGYLQKRENMQDDHVRLSHNAI